MKHWARTRAALTRPAVVLACLLMAGLTGCVQVPTGNSPPTSQGPPQSPREQLLSMKAVDDESLSVDQDTLPLAFLSMDRNAYCVIGPKQGGVLENPVDPLMGVGEKDDTKLEVTAVYCEFVTYPEPAEVTDDCNGTNLRGTPWKLAGTVAAITVLA